MTETSRGRAALTLLLQVALSALFIYLTLRKIELDEVWKGITRVSIAILSLSLLSKLTGFLLMSLRSRMLFAPLHRYSMFTLLRSIFVAFVGNNLLPLRMGELLRVHFLADKGGLSHGSCLAVIVLERLLDAFCLLLVFFACLPVIWDKMPDYHALTYFGLLLLLFLGLALFLNRRPQQMIGLCRLLTKPLGGKISGFITTQLERFARGLSGLASPTTVALVVMVSVGYWMTHMCSIRIWIWAFGWDLPWYAPLVILIFISFGTMLPATPGYVGTYHYFTKMALSLFGVAASAAATFAIVGHAMAIVPFTILGAPLVLNDLLFRKKQGWKMRHNAQ